MQNNGNIRLQFLTALLSVCAAAFLLTMAAYLDFLGIFDFSPRWIVVEEAHPQTPKVEPRPVAKPWWLTFDPTDRLDGCYTTPVDCTTQPFLILGPNGSCEEGFHCCGGIGSVAAGKWTYDPGRCALNILWDRSRCISGRKDREGRLLHPTRVDWLKSDLETLRVVHLKSGYLLVRDSSEPTSSFRRFTGKKLEDVARECPGWTGTTWMPTPDG